MSIPVVLTIAGSDSGGGAGIQADLKTFHAFATFGTTALTAVTVQNTLGVSAVHPIPLDIVRAQIDTVVADLRPAAVKSGMLATAALTRVVAERIRSLELPNYVLDPVMVATSGDRLLDPEAEGTLTRELLPLASLVTPNLDEASILAGFPVETPEQMRRAAARLVELGASAALVKGGHLRTDPLTDILYDGREWHHWERPKQATTSTHGTGCTLSAAIAGALAHGRPLLRAVAEGLDYVERAMRSAPGLGQGHGPLNHLVPGVPA